MSAAPPVQLPTMEAAVGGRIVAVGIAITRVSELRSSVRALGDGYLSRVFTARELADCRTSADPEPRLAARLAAKEATLEALGIASSLLPWTTMEVRRNPAGWCEEVRLSGSMQRVSRIWPRARILVSLSHDGDQAAAFVAATYGYRARAA